MFNPFKPMQPSITVPAGALPKVGTVPSHHSVTGDYRLDYLGTRIPFILAFLALLVAIYWTVGKKGTFEFLLLVLAGQLLGNASTISQYFSGKEG